MSDTIKVQLIGQFRVSDGDIVLEEKDFHSNTLIQMLTYFLLKRDQVLTKDDLVDVFCYRSNKSPEGTLKNLIYRLRTVLKQLGDIEYIQSVSRGYQWNKDIKVKSDIIDYQRIALILEDEEDEGVQRELCRKAMNFYGSSIAKMLYAEPWMKERVTTFNQSRKRISKINCHLYQKNGNWDELETLAAHMLEFYPLDEEYHCFFINSLKGRQMYDRAIRHYEQAYMKLYESESGRHMDKLQSTYSDLLTQMEEYTRNLDAILTEVGEESAPHGAYFCDYDTFRQIYQVESRRISRQEDLNVNVMLLTINWLNRQETERTDIDKKKMSKGMDELAETIGRQLRVGDVVARCSATQYVVLLSQCNFNNGAGVAERIRRSFQGKNPDKPLELTYELEEVRSYQWQHDLLAGKDIG